MEGWDVAATSVPEDSAIRPHKLQSIKSQNQGNSSFIADWRILHSFPVFQIHRATIGNTMTVKEVHADLTIIGGTDSP